MATPFEAVKRILNAATDGRAPSHVGHNGDGNIKPLGLFWTQDLDKLITTVIYDEPVIVLGNPGASALIKALKGLKPFDGSKFEQMPQGLNPVSAADIAFIEKWIQDGCPGTSSIDELPA